MDAVAEQVKQQLAEGKLVGFRLDASAGEDAQASKLSVSKLGATKSGLSKG